MRLVIECVLQEFGSLIEAAICDIDVSLGQGIPSGRRQLVRRSAGGAGKGGGLWMLLSDIDESRRSDAQVFDGLFSQQAFLQFGFLHRVTT